MEEKKQTRKEKQLEKHLEAVVEAVLFTMGKSVELRQLAIATGQSEEETGQAVERLKARYDKEERGMEIIELEDSYQMCTKAEFESHIRLALELKNNTPLSAAALEVLAIVAYHQPVTKAFLEQVRGVDSSSVLNGLFAKGLVEERGRLELPGRPLLYGTTQNFLRCMGLSSLEELPEVPDPKDTAEKANENDAADDKQLKLEDV